MQREEKKVLTRRAVWWVAWPTTVKQVASTLLLLPLLPRDFLVFPDSPHCPLDHVVARQSKSLMRCHASHTCGLRVLFVSVFSAKLSVCLFFLVFADAARRRSASHVWQAKRAVQTKRSISYSHSSKSFPHKRCKARNRLHHTTHRTTCYTAGLLVTCISPSCSMTRAPPQKYLLFYSHLFCLCRGLRWASSCAYVLRAPWLGTLLPSGTRRLSQINTINNTPAHSSQRHNTTSSTYKHH